MGGKKHSVHLLGEERVSLDQGMLQNGLELAHQTNESVNLRDHLVVVLELC